MIPGEWRRYSNQGLLNITNMGTSNNYTKIAKQVRDDFRDYFYSEAGSVPWQLNTIKSTTEEFDE